MKVQKKGVLAILAGVVVAGALGASATTLGGLDSAVFGADKTVVAAPVKHGVVVTWETAYDAAATAYVVDDVALTTADATERIPAGAEVRLAVTGTKGLLGEFVSTDAGANWTEPAKTILAEDVTGVAVVINGDAVSVEG